MKHVDDMLLTKEELQKKMNRGLTNARNAKRKQGVAEAGDANAKLQCDHVVMPLRRECMSQYCGCLA